MEKSNQKLIIGLIIGLLLGLVIALYALDYFPAITSFLFYLLIALFFIALVGVLAYTWFKDWILQKIFGEDFKEEKAKEDLQQLYEQVAVKYVGQLLQDVPEEQREKAEVATPRLLKFGVWAFTRSWALRLLITIFVAVGGLLGTMLLYNQNQLLTSQNEKIDLQNNLLEADRRSSLVFLMSNVLDKVDEEVKSQETRLRYNSQENNALLRYRLSDQLIGRIIALGRGFKPYRMMEADSLTKILSPERGQLFIALMETDLDSTTQNTIVQRGNFNYAVIREINLEEANFKHANLKGANIMNSNLKGGDLQKAKLDEAILIGSNLSRSNLNESTLTNADLHSADLSYTNLVDAMLDDVNLNESSLKYSDLSNSSLKNSDFVKTNLYGTRLVKANLNNVTIDEADMRKSNLNAADIRNSLLTRSTIIGSNLRGVDLDSTDLSYSEMSVTNLRSANLRNANLQNVYLWKAVLDSADLSYANLYEADLWRASFKATDFFNTKNLTIEQLLSARSLYQCKNLSPEIEYELQKEKPCLFTKEGCPENEK